MMVCTMKVKTQSDDDDDDDEDDDVSQGKSYSVRRLVYVAIWLIESEIAISMTLGRCVDD